MYGTNPAGLILEQMFRFGKGWPGQKIWIRQLPAAAGGKEQRACGRAVHAKAPVGLEAKTLPHPCAMSRGIHSPAIPAVMTRKKIRWAGYSFIFESARKNSL